MHRADDEIRKRDRKGKKPKMFGKTTKAFHRMPAPQSNRSMTPPALASSDQSSPIKSDQIRSKQGERAHRPTEGKLVSCDARIGTELQTCLEPSKVFDISIDWPWAWGRPPRLVVCYMETEVDVDRT
mmetsp:Transcript_66038/g.137934  ORF Transcript_66038/g.137934 Transcript_66038/m.137934 type:complete len:127 (+) Transcript_66038:212-592(+)